MQIVFRVDASVGLGSGHVMRCAALALSLRRAGAQCKFLCRELEGNLCQWLADQGFAVASIGHSPARTTGRPNPWDIDTHGDANATVKALSVGPRPDWLVVDHYGIDSSWEEVVRPRVGRMLIIDDLANRVHIGDVLVDQNFQPHADRYDDRIPASCKRLLGPRYALLRPDFAAIGPETSNVRSPDRKGILACVGGTDPKDVLSKVLAAWKSIAEPRPALDIAVGQNSPNVKELESATRHLAHVTLHVQTPDMARLMASSELLIGSTGSITWERCCAGLAAIMGVTADNQKLNLEMLARLRTGISLGDWAGVSVERLALLMQQMLGRPSLLAKMSARARSLVDGRGAQRVAMLMLGKELLLRRATNSDAEMAWPWRNAESTRRFFFNTQPISLASHLNWWNAVLADPNRVLLIGMIGDWPVGVLRLDCESSKAVISIYLDPALTGLGLGTELLIAASQWSKTQMPEVTRLVAEILPENAPSVSAFRAAGFVSSNGKWIREV